MIALNDQFLPGMLRHALMHPLGVNGVRGVLQYDRLWRNSLCLVFQIRLIRALYITTRYSNDATNATEDSHKSPSPNPVWGRKNLLQPAPTLESLGIQDPFGMEHHFTDKDRRTLATHLSSYEK